VICFGIYPMKENSMKKISRIFGMGLALAVVLSCSSGAIAQRFGGGPPMAPEKAEAVWTLQANAMGTELSLGKKAQPKLAKTYLAARKSHQAAMAGLGDQQGDRQARFQAFREVNEQERAKLEEALKGILKKDKLETAISVLGTFDRRWDNYTNVVIGLSLDKAKSGAVMKEVNGWVAKSTKARQEAMAQQDWQSMRERGQELKAALDGALEKVLSTEQQAEWTEKTARRGRGPGGGGGRGPGGPGGGPRGPGGGA
jgi:hypothetical protein